MGKSYFDEAEEERGFLPALTGALFTIRGIERGKTSEQAKTPGCRKFVVDLQVKEPKEFAGTILFDHIMVGTAEDPFAKKPETWRLKGAGRIKRLLIRSGTPLTDDDEEWMEAAKGNEVVAPVTARADDKSPNGVSNNVGLYYRPTDEDCPEIGVADPSKPRGGGKKPAGGAANAGKKAAGKTTTDDDESAGTTQQTTAAPATGKGKPAPAPDPDDDEE